MSTIEEFENAPFGATATAPNGNIAIKTGRSVFEWSVYDSRGRPRDNHSSDEMWRYTLNPVAPTTAREALDLAWELAHPVREGQEVQVGTELIARFEDGDFRTYRANKPFEGTSEPGWAETRTLDPLPDPVPDWLDAPAVMAHAEDEEPHVWVNIDARGWRDEHGNTRQWTALRDVTPLYPKEDA